MFCHRYQPSHYQFQFTSGSSMSYRSKLIAAHEELEQAGIWKSNFNPPLFRLLRKLGVKYPPPYYRSFQSNFLTSFVFFTPVWGILMYFLGWQASGKSITESAITALVGGLLYGLITALYYSWKSKRCKLTKWENI